TARTHISPLQRAPHPTRLHSFPTRRSSDLDRRLRLVTMPTRLDSPAETEDRRRNRNRKRFASTVQQQRIAVVCSALPSQTHKFRSEEHTSELQSRGHLVCRLLLEKKKQKRN